MDLYTQSYALDRGLDSIVFVDKQKAGALPEGQRALLPPDEGMPAKLRQLLDKPDLSDYLESTFGPISSNGSLLSPQGFGNALQHTRNELQQMWGIATDTEASTSATAPLSVVISRALRVLSGESDLRAELAAYQGLLLRG